jgi:hypothetical protein
MFRLFIWLAVLNFIDGVATYLGYRGNIIQEVNPIMAEIMGKSTFNFLLLKVIVSLVLVGLSFIAYKTENMRVLRITLKIAVLAYGVITLMHAVWFILYLSM